ncbi:hypothetical protein CEXT_80121 [Caerostris extrusa]|uniref:Uncharacterized protein n=1 Tax=Caerostris extrusa TaxID=172846 RepID=A0AAV4XA76_CAEEX|nr:hypothetical protein CEXT_80121 [Caerostris extrusa]
MRFVKSVQKIFQDDGHTSLDLVVTKTSSHTITNIENSTVIDHGINLAEPTLQILDKQTCHSNELLIDVLEEVQSSPELEIITTKICSKNMQQNTGGLNSEINILMRNKFPIHLILMHYVWIMGKR